MARELEAGPGDDLRIICPDCETTWSTVRVPSECPECGALVTLRVVKRPDAKAEAEPTLT